MADINYFKTEDGSVALPVSSDSEFTTDLINYEEGSLCEAYFEFYSDEELTVPVTPTGGTISVTGSPLGKFFLPPNNAQEVLASNVSYPEAEYTPPAIDGLVRRAKVSVAGITGASYMKALIFNHD